MDVRIIAAVGRSGQIGLGGFLPWHDREDLKRFSFLTEGGFLVAGYRTYATIKHLHGTRQRYVTQDFPGHTDPNLMREAAVAAGKNCVWVVGGAKTYAKWLPFVDDCVISRINYDGPADTFMPALWNAR